MTRSQLIFRAEPNIPSRFLMVRIVSSASRKLHIPGNRIGQTINEVLALAATETLTAPPEPMGPVAILPDAEEFLPQRTQRNTEEVWQ